MKIIQSIILFVLLFLGYSGRSQCDSYIDSYYDSIVFVQHYFGIDRSLAPPISLDIQEKDGFFKILLSVKTAGLKFQNTDSVLMKISVNHADDILKTASFESERVGNLYRYSATTILDLEELKSLGKHQLKNIRVGSFYSFVNKDQAQYFKSVAHCLDKKLHQLE